MGEFFRGWRRKIGLLTLLMACVFAAGWVRSQYKCDNFVRRNAQWRDCIVSVDGRLMLHRTVPLNEGPGYIRLFGNEFEWTSRDVSSVAGFELDADGKRPPFNAFDRLDHVLWRLDWAGFTFGASLKKPSLVRRLDLVLIPYWSIVVPLTLLSAFLLLWKPRKSTSKKNPEPIPLEGN